MSFYLNLDNWSYGNIVYYGNILLQSAICSLPHVTPSNLIVERVVRAAYTALAVNFYGCAAAYTVCVSSYIVIYL